MTTADAHQLFRDARDRLLSTRTDQARAVADYVPPRPAEFNWALDWFDRVAATPETGQRAALRIIDQGGSGGSPSVEQTMTYAEMSRRSSQVAAWLAHLGVRRGDRVLLMLGNQVELWETLLACTKLGAVVIPATTLLTSADLRDRIDRGAVRHVVVGADDTAKLADVPGDYTRVAVGERSGGEGWTAYRDAQSFEGEFTPEGTTRGDDTLLLYFTSGTTAQPKLVEHTQTSYPVGHLSTMYWIGLQPGDVHLNISSPGWAKHAWSSFFAPWNAEATILVVNQPRFDAAALLQVMADEEVTTFCAPPTVYRMLIQQDLAAWKDRLSVREMVGAGEPLNPEVIEQVRTSLGRTIRDGYGQTETTAQVGNCPGQELVLGSMGKPLPGYDVVLLDPVTGEERTGPGEEGELCLRLDGPGGRPVGLMTGYHGDGGRTDEAMRHGAYHTGDVAVRDDRGYITYVGRADDVFKASDYRISPFELESVLIEHPAVAEAAVVPSPDPTRLSVPKAYVVLATGHEPTKETAEQILRYAREHLAPYKRIRRIEFGELPKTISGKIRRVELRGREDTAHGTGDDVTVRASEFEFWESDFPDLKA
ncbi:MAG TPA: AMP-binding protein [Segeticoccus sp.]|uniref:AMP-binding protein n=1 Tax=Segeticoccus sp. TaxID=2706531 RepID=UPI002D80E855|nr:AMP-binding protein [Segeticoccus sp.]HET8598907.1 AMP-binding protein [Segeticoccus sp.]